MHRINCNAARAQPMRQFPRVQRYGELGLSVELQRLIRSMTVQVVEHDASLRGMRNARAAARENDASAVVADEVDYLINQGEVADIIDEKLHFDATPDLQRWRYRNARVGNESVEGYFKTPYCPGRRNNGSEIGQITRNWDCASSGFIAGGFCAGKRSGEADDMSPVCSQRVHRLESYPGAAPGDQEVLPGEIDAREDLVCRGARVMMDCACVFGDAAGIRFECCVQDMLFVGHARTNASADDTYLVAYMCRYKVSGKWIYAGWRFARPTAYLYRGCR